MAADDPAPAPPGGGHARMLAIGLLALMAVLLVVALFFNPMTVK